MLVRFRGYGPGIDPEFAGRGSAGGRSARWRGRRRTQHSCAGRHDRVLCDHRSRRTSMPTRRRRSPLHRTVQPRPPRPPSARPCRRRARRPDRPRSPRPLASPALSMSESCRHGAPAHCDSRVRQMWIACEMCSMEVAVTDDAARMLEEAGTFLRSKPAEHNLVLTLLTERAAHPEPGRFWSVRRGGDVVAVMFQSPLDFHASITPAPADAVAALTEAAAEIAPDLPGVMGEAATAAFFAGCWAERLKTPATPVEGQRLYELGTLRPPDGVQGQLRRARDDDAERLIGWIRGFEVGTGGAAVAPETLRRRIAAGLVWIWLRDEHEPVAMAALTTPLAGVTRVGLVYTPPEHRRHGY